VDSQPPPELTAWTIGHSNHPPEHFFQLLAQQQIDVLADVRSSPYCRYATHFNKEPLRAAVQAEGIKYLFLGDLLGGRVDDPRLCDADGHVLYGRVAETPGFRQGIRRLIEGLGKFRVALMCGEENPAECHRRLLIGRVLGQRGVAVFHLRGDGRVQSEAELAAEEEFRKTKGQMTLFEMEQPDPWKSTQSVLPKRPPENSSPSSGEPKSGG